MEIEKISTDLLQVIDGSCIFKDEPMKKHTSFKIGGNADLLIKVKELDELRKVMQIIPKYKVPYYILGNGSNVLVKDKGIRGIVILMDMTNIRIDQEQDNIKITAEAGVKLGQLAQKCAKLEIAGLEFAAGIPGTIGGAIRMNAGAHGKEMKDIVLETTYMDQEANVHTIQNQAHEFAYRKSIFCKKKYIILQTVLNLKKGKKEEIEEKMNEYASYRKEKQPIQFPSAGSTFKRGTDFITAQLIDEAGLKGKSIGGAKISELHAGFIINQKDATAKDVLELVEYTKKVVKEKFNKELELEIEIIGE